MVVDQLTERRVHRRFVHARLLYVTADAEQLGAAVLLWTELGEPLRAVEDDQRHVAERFDVVHRGRAVVQPLDGWERRLQPRLRARPCERFDERRLLARLVRAGAAVHEDVALEAAAEDVLPEVAGLVGLLEL